MVFRIQHNFGFGKNIIMYNLLSLYTLIYSTLKYKIMLSPETIGRSYNELLTNIIFKKSIVYQYFVNKKKKYSKL